MSTKLTDELADLTIQQVSRRTGLAESALRYYERIGLLDRITRSAGGRRQFNEDHLEWLGVLRCLRETGMPIAASGIAGNANAISCHQERCSVSPRLSREAGLALASG